MRAFFYTLILILSALIIASCSNETEEKIDFALVIHGGAGVMSEESMSAEQQQKYMAKLEEALDSGLHVLGKGGASIDAVEKVIRILEDSPLFNAGKGAVFTHTGSHELDASIMTGHDMNAGAVAGVSHIRNPISAARKVMTHSEHVLLSGKGAEEFAVKMGIEMVDPSYFSTKHRFESLKKAIEAEGGDITALQNEKFGTVGCVALDKAGNLCAGTSTGGRTNKKFGRIGDSPLIGAGNYAKNSSCGVSATGHGEYFIRYAVAHEISSLMEQGKMNVREAAREVIHKQLVEAGGGGGVICLDNKGNYAMEFNTEGMFRAYANSAGEKKVRIFK